MRRVFAIDIRKNIVRVQSEHNQTELGHVRRGGMRERRGATYPEGNLHQDTS